MAAGHNENLLGPFFVSELKRTKVRAKGVFSNDSIRVRDEDTF